MDADVQETTRVAVLDDDVVVLDYLQDVLSAEPGFDLVGCSTTVADALTLLKAHEPRVFLVDLELPDGSGLEVIRAARQLGNTDTIVISVFGDERNTLSALRAGAAGYLLKDDVSSRIVGDIHAVLAGGAPMSAAIAGHVLRMVRQSPADASDQKSLVDPATIPKLTKRELEVLQQIASGFRRQEVATRLHITLNTVGTHINHIYEKLAVGSNVEAARRASDLGLLD